MAKTIGPSLIPEFIEECGNTGKLLALIPEDKGDWKLSEKFNSISSLARHIADIAGWTPGIFFAASYDIASDPPSESAFNLQELLKTFDSNVEASKKALETVEDSELENPWSLLAGGNVLFTEKKGTVYRKWVINHTVHHRAHLSVYLRSLGIKVPGMYGPSGE